MKDYNPFKENRAEQMRNLLDYYVEIPGIDGSKKPIVIEGSRGSGKTMLFLCNSWKEVLSKIKENKGKSSKLYTQSESFIGIYYRVDTTFVSSMRGRGLSDEKWNSIFETYFSICLLQEFIDLLINISEDTNFDDNKISFFCKEISTQFYPNSKVDKLNRFRSETELYLNNIEDIINGIRISNEFRFVNGLRFVRGLCNKIILLLDHDVIFKVFIDEYETLQERQQRIINSFIKHSELPVIFNIGLRCEGMKTKKTISDTEIIEAPNDYDLITLGLNNIDERMYTKVLKEICEKRISLGKKLNKIPAYASEWIDYYLGKYNIDDEINYLIDSDLTSELINIITIKYSEEAIDDTPLEKYIDKLSSSNVRIHYMILKLRRFHNVKLKELYEENIGSTDKYKEWLKMKEYNSVFELVKEYKKNKLYYGFETFVDLSSNIVRYFLELCEQAFRFAFLDGFDWKEPIDKIVQTSAAKHVSRYKMHDILGYEPYGNVLRIFIQHIGEVFSELHSQKILGESEINCFSVNYLELKDNEKNRLSSAIMWSILQSKEYIKNCNFTNSEEIIDFYINKIYVPYFGISHKNGGKLYIENNVLEKLLCGDFEQVKKITNGYLKDDI